MNAKKLGFAVLILFALIGLLTVIADAPLAGKELRNAWDTCWAVVASATN